MLHMLHSLVNMGCRNSLTHDSPTITSHLSVLFDPSLLSRLGFAIVVPMELDAPKLGENTQVL